MLKTNRGVIKLFLLSLITLGIYGLYFISVIANDANIVCEGDQKKTRGLVAYILLSLITLGIYAVVWELMLVNRIDNVAPRYELKSEIGVGGYLLWCILGSLIIVGPIIAEYKFFKNMNAVCYMYNQSQAVTSGN